MKKDSSHPVCVAIGTLLFLTLTTAVFSVVLGYSLQHINFIKRSDAWLYQIINNGRHYQLVDILITPFNFNFLFPIPGNAPNFFYFMLTFAGIYLYIKDRAELKWFLLSIGIGTIVVHLITLSDVHFIFRIRPFITLKNTVTPQGYGAWKNLSSYPSGHVRDTALYSALIAFFIPKTGWWLVVFTIFIGYSRVYIGAHFPSDVLAGALLGYISAYLTLRFIHDVRVAKTKSSPQEPVTTVAQ